MIIADTSGLLAFFNASEPTHAAVQAIVTEEVEPMVVSPYVLAELDYLVAGRVGVAVELEVLAELTAGAYDLAQLSSSDVARAREVIQRYGDQNVGLTDASLVVLADRYSTSTLLTLDRRHFEVVRPLAGGHFTVLP